MHQSSNYAKKIWNLETTQQIFDGPIIYSVALQNKKGRIWSELQPFFLIHPIHIHEL